MNPAGIRVAVAGVRGKMGQTAANFLRKADGISYVGGLVHEEPDLTQGEFSDAGRLLGESRPDVLVDFTVFPASKAIALAAVAGGVRPVIGTSGYGLEDVEDLRSACQRAGVGAVLVPNFAIGAVLMMRFAETAAGYFAGVEIVEMHEAGKKDAPSGTAMATARRIAGAAKFAAAPTELFRALGARGATIDGVGVHSLRLPGVVTHQEVFFAGEGQVLSIKHESFSRDSFMSGLLVAVRAAASLSRLVEGLDDLL